MKTTLEIPDPIIARRGRDGRLSSMGMMAGGRTGE